MPSRALFLAACLLVPAAASATVPAPAMARHRHHVRPAVAAARPVAPVPRDTSLRVVDGEVTRPAPVPDEDVTAPSDVPNRHATTTPALFSLHYPPIGNGYPYGSSPQAMDDSRTAEVPGVELRKPLQ